MKDFLKKTLVFLGIVGMVFTFFSPTISVFAQQGGGTAASDEALLKKSEGWFTYGWLVDLLQPAADHTVDPENTKNKIIGIVKDASDQLLKLLANLLLVIGAFFLFVAGSLFNISLSYSLNMGQFLKDLPIIDIAWPVFRDVANICFIFILLAIAFGTILQIDSISKKLLVRVVVIALLLNFSLFFTKVIVDASNILALSVYQNMTVDRQVPTGVYAVDFLSKADQGLTMSFIKGLGLQSIYSSATPNNTAAQQGEAARIVGRANGAINVLVVGIGGFVLLIVAAFVFLVASILFLIRTVFLIFLMIVSPVAFAANILPKTQQYFSKWLGLVINQSFFAPVYLMMTWIVVAIISYRGGKSFDGQDMNFAALMTGERAFAGTIYTYGILVAFMLGSLLVAKSFGAAGGDFAKNMAGKVSFGAIGWAGRKTFGRSAQNYLNSDQGKLDKNGNAYQRARYALRSQQAKGTWDVRNVGGFGKVAGGLGKVGGEGGYQKEDEAKKKRFKDQQATYEEIKKEKEKFTQHEENKMNESEESKKHAQSIQAEALLREHDKAVEAKDEKRRESNALHVSLSGLDAQLKATEAQVTSSRMEEDEKVKNITALKARIEAETIQKTAADEAVKQHASEEAYKKDLLGKLNSDYKELEENRDRIQAKIKENADKADAYAKANGIDRTTIDSKKINDDYVKKHTNEISDLKSEAKQRGVDYLQPSKKDLRMAAKGKTSARMAAINKVRNDARRKTPEKDLFEKMKKAYAEEYADKDKGSEAKAEEKK